MELVRNNKYLAEPLHQEQVCPSEGGVGGAVSQ